MLLTLDVGSRLAALEDGTLPLNIEEALRRASVTNSMVVVEAAAALG